jgi:hypothetical protein
MVMMTRTGTDLRTIYRAAAVRSSDGSGKANVSPALPLLTEDQRRAKHMKLASPLRPKWYFCKFRVPK